MPTIHLTIFIEAPIERVFDLSRSIDLHSVSMQSSNEKAIDGIMTGLINKDETVTWQAHHLFKKRTHKSIISQLTFPTYFQDEMLEGDFKSMRHEHHFKPVANGTIMIDIIHFESPYGRVGKLANAIFLTRYLKKLIETRNLVIKQYAESNKWKSILKEHILTGQKTTCKAF